VCLSACSGFIDAPGEAGRASDPALTPRHRSLPLPRRTRVKTGTPLPRRSGIATASSAGAVGPTETAIHIAIVNLLYLALPKGAIIHHSHNEGKRSKADAGKAKAMGQRPGFPDIIIMWQRVTYMLEVKTATGRQSNVQKDFERDAAATGFPFYAIVRSVSEAEATLKAWGIPIRTVGNARLDGRSGCAQK
jgi:hypothetical protein